MTGDVIHFYTLANPKPHTHHVHTEWRCGRCGAVVTDPQTHRKEHRV